MLADGKYQLLGTLGQGTSGTVYLAYQWELGRQVAVKQLAPHLAEDDAALERFRLEARTMARLDSPHCVRVFELVEEGGHCYLVGEYVDGASLRAVVRESGRLTAPQAAGVIKGSLLGLGHAHELGLVHRDVKPENILADREGTSKLADFGQAMPVDARVDGSPSGTPAYMSPEQVLGHALDARSDIYSAGAVLFELLAGQPPYSAGNSAALMRRHVQGKLPDPRRAGISDAISEVLVTALARRPEERYQTAEEFLSALEEAAERDLGAGWESSSGLRAAVAVAAAAAGSIATAAAALGAPAGAAGSSAVAGATTGAGGTTASPAVSTPPGVEPAAEPARPGIGARRGIVRSLRGRNGAVVAAVAGIALMATVAAVAGVGPFSPGPSVASKLASAFGPAAPATAGGLPGGPALSAPVMARTGGGVVETFRLEAPARVDFNFGYCSAQVCGTSENLECVGNQYIPGFGDSVPMTVRVASPPGYRVDSALISGGPAEGAATTIAYASAATSTGSVMLKGAPILRDGILQFELAVPWAADIQKHYNPRFDRICGFSAQQLADWSSAHGTHWDNPYPVLILSLHMTGDGAGGQQDVIIDRDTRKLRAQVPSAPAGALRTPTAFTQSDSRWSSTAEAGTRFGDSGTVPTAVAIVLSAFSASHAQPPEVAKQLRTSGAWTPGKGTSWSGLQDYLRAHRLTVSETDLFGPAGNTPGTIWLVAYTDRTRPRTPESVLVVTGYDPEHDTFSVLDPASTRTEMSWYELEPGDPWVLAVRAETAS